MFHLWFHARAWKINYNALHHFCASLGQIEWQNKQSVLTWGSNVLPNPQAWFRLATLLETFSATKILKSCTVYTTLKLFHKETYYFKNLHLICSLV
jgi:hypothetical protein